MGQELHGCLHRLDWGFVCVPFPHVVWYALLFQHRFWQPGRILELAGDGRRPLLGLESLADQSRSLDASHGDWDSAQFRLVSNLPSSVRPELWKPMFVLRAILGQPSNVVAIAGAHLVKSGQLEATGRFPVTVDCPREDRRRRVADAEKKLAIVPRVER